MWKKGNCSVERDFAQFDQKLKQKPTLSTISACGLIMFTNNKTSYWFSSKSKEGLEKLVDITRKNKHDRIKKYKKRKEEILTLKWTKWKKRN